MKIAVGQQWIMNRSPDGILHADGRDQYTIHVIGLATDMKGKHKIAIQLEYQHRSKWRAPNYAPAKLVSPQYFFGLIVKIKKGKDSK